MTGRQLVSFKDSELGAKPCPLIIGILIRNASIALLPAFDDIAAEHLSFIIATDPQSPLLVI
jgi:hypothetical protein